MTRAVGWIQDRTVGEVIAFAAVVLAAAGVLRKVWPFARKIVHFVDDVMGAPGRPGVAARPSLMERVASMEAAQNDIRDSQQTIRAEVMNNGGKSLKDKVEQTQRDVAVLAERFDRHLGVAQQRWGGTGGDDADRE